MNVTDFFAKLRHESDAREEQQHKSQDDLPRDGPDDGQVGRHEGNIGATLEQQSQLRRRGAQPYCQADEVNEQQRRW